MRRSIPISNLVIDTQNPRYDPRASQREALRTIVLDQGPKLLNLAEDIIDRGLNPSDLLIVGETNDPTTFEVLEGNRRLVALKLLSSPQLLSSLDLPATLAKRYKELQDRVAGTLPSELECVVLPREDANEWIRVKHTGENEGVGVVSWDARARQRFLGSSPALQAIELIENSDLLDESTRSRLPKIAITNIERLLATPEARALLRCDIKNGRLVLNPPEDEALARLAVVVSDVANRRVRVTHLDTKEQRIQYAQAVASSPLSGRATRAQRAREPGRRPRDGVSTHRRALIPRHLKLRIQPPRINRIFEELQKLSVLSYVNSCAVMLRVFVELSVDEYSQGHGVSLRVKPKARKTSRAAVQPREMYLREKLRTVADHLEVKGISSKDELHGVRTLISNRYHVLSIDTLNAYVHNRHYNPTAGDLITSWDNIEPFVKRLWAS